MSSITLSIKFWIISKTLIKESIPIPSYSLTKTRDLRFKGNMNYCDLDIQNDNKFLDYMGAEKIGYKRCRVFKFL